MIALKIFVIALAVLFALFLLSLAVYFLNLDMKFAAAITPVMNKYYDWQKRKRQAKQNKGREAGSDE